MPHTVWNALIISAGLLFGIFGIFGGELTDLLRWILISFLFAVTWYTWYQSDSGSPRGDGKGQSETSVYGLDHGKLHLQPQTAMWMNMGYWLHDPKCSDCNDEDAECTTALRPKTLAEACRDLVTEVLATAGFDRKIESSHHQKGTRKSKSIIDVGFGCGDQTIYLMDDVPIRKSDHEWWDSRLTIPHFDTYIGITIDKKQFRYAEERVRELRESLNGPRVQQRYEQPKIDIFLDDAGKPTTWNAKLKKSVEQAAKETEEHWVLALDTAYHFSPSRWPFITHVSRSLNASFMAFDLCLSSTATLSQKLRLRALTTIMGAPWANFVTADAYRNELVKAGYHESRITIRDISEHVFEPLAAHIEAQDERLRAIGCSVGSFNVAKRMFRWWARSGVVRGVIVVAESREDR